MDFPPDDVKTLVTKIAAILRSRNETLAISEAGCGGLISAYLVLVPGALDFYIGGKLVYSLKQRLRLSGWLDKEITEYMGPSEQIALKLARTTKYELGSTYVLSETGFAGPSTDLHLNNSIELKKEEPTLVSLSGDLVDVLKGSTNENINKDDKKSENLTLHGVETSSVSSVSSGFPGTVYLGFSGPNIQVSKEGKTDNLSRSSNMTEFAKLGLEFLLEQLESISKVAIATKND